MFTLDITRPARRDLREAFEWWRDHRSSEEADRWFERIEAAIQTLVTMADCCPQAPESHRHPHGLRELHFGIGSRPTHRVVFTIEEGNVSVLRVLHTARRALRVSDLGWPE